MDALGISILSSLEGTMNCRSGDLGSGSAVMHEVLVLDSTDAPFAQCQIDDL